MSYAQAKATFRVVRDIEREDTKFISKTLGCLPLTVPYHVCVQYVVPRPPCTGQDPMKHAIITPHVHSC